MECGVSQWKYAGPHCSSITYIPLKHMLRDCSEFIARGGWYFLGKAHVENASPPLESLSKMGTVFGKIEAWSQIEACLV